jgi:hypothetical protein
MNDTVVYAYAIARGPDMTARAWVAGLTGIDGTALRALDCGDCGEITALVSDVEFEQFEDAQLRRNLEDLAWIERVAREHDRVVREVAAYTTVVPLRLATIFTSDVSAREQLDQRREASLSALERVAGRDEWGVKAYPVSAVEAGAEPEPVPAGAVGPGRAYLQRRQMQLQWQEQSLRAAMAEAEQVYCALVQLAVAGRRHPPQDLRLSGRHEPMVLNAAFLVDTASAGTFALAVKQANAEHSGLELELTGPWPPYSFAIPGPE